MDHAIFRSLLQVDDIPRIPSISVRRQSDGGTSDQGDSSEASVFEASPVLAPFAVDQAADLCSCGHENDDSAARR